MVSGTPTGRSNQNDAIESAVSQGPQTSSDTAKPAVPLFRREVLEARQAQWLGSIRIGRPLSFSVVTGAALAMAAALVAFACWGTLSSPRCTIPAGRMRREFF